MRTKRLSATIKGCANALLASSCSRATVTFRTRFKGIGRSNALEDDPYFLVLHRVNHPMFSLERHAGLPSLPAYRVNPRLLGCLLSDNYDFLWDPFFGQALVILILGFDSPHHLTLGLRWVMIPSGTWLTAKPVGKPKPTVRGRYAIKSGPIPQ